MGPCLFEKEAQKVVQTKVDQIWLSKQKLIIRIALTGPNTHVFEGIVSTPG